MIDEDGTHMTFEKPLVLIRVSGADERAPQDLYSNGEAKWLAEGPLSGGLREWEWMPHDAFSRERR